MAALSSHFLETSKSVDQNFRSQKIKQAKKDAEMRMKQTLITMQKNSEKIEHQRSNKTTSSFFTGRHGLKKIAESHLSLS